MGLRDGVGATTAPVAPAVAFAFLADPRNAPEWFAPVTFARAEDDAPSQTGVLSSGSVLRVGASWRFIPHRPASEARANPRPGATIPVRMAAYEPPTHFAWETTYPSARDNLRWEITCEDTASDSASAPSAQTTTIRMRIRIQPGPLGWVSLLMAAPFTRGGLDRRTQRALDRAHETLVARAELAAQPRPPRPPRLPRGDERRGDKRKRSR